LVSLDWIAEVFFEHPGSFVEHLADGAERGKKLGVFGVDDPGIGVGGGTDGYDFRTGLVGREFVEEEGGGFGGAICWE